MHDMTTNKSLEKRQPGDVEPAQDQPVFVPTTDIYEKDTAVLVRCDMPGVDEKSLEITLEDGVLTLTGTQADAAREGYDCLLGEYRSGLFRRTFSLNQDIDHGNITARIKDGVLDIELPKSERAQPKKIAVHVG
jgi:HSP20 family molecular chaperone IbpA